MKTDSITKLADMYNSMGFQMFQSDKLSNNLFINDEERAKRIRSMRRTIAMILCTLKSYKIG